MDEWASNCCHNISLMQEVSRIVRDCCVRRNQSFGLVSEAPSLRFHTQIAIVLTSSALHLTREKHASQSPKQRKKTQQLLHSISLRFFLERRDTPIPDHQSFKGIEFDRGLLILSILFFFFFIANLSFQAQDVLPRRGRRNAAAHPPDAARGPRGTPKDEQGKAPRKRTARL